MSISSLLEEVKDLYLEAAHQNGDMIDPDLQTGLGVLFHLNGEFNRAIDAFSAALTVRPERGRQQLSHCSQFATEEQESTTGSPSCSLRQYLGSPSNCSVYDGPARTVPSCQRGRSRHSVKSF
ncbi:pex5-related hypothetical protein [Limosa lapponica baueri]|uniref:Uncharacterized protein n=1 Tax=Limosa lapponica baueri TaxID=1758121 RepID=A0A2I0TME1_LIMLA|nr:pex5-related hypothetical protein [Limosa lapponica baueri]